MPIRTISYLKQKFSQFMRPSDADFADLIDTTAGMATNAVSGWVALYRDIQYDAGVVRQLCDYANGSGDKPTANIGMYIKADGSFTANIAEAANFSPIKIGTFDAPMLALPTGEFKQSPVMNNALNYDGLDLTITDGSGHTSSLVNSIYHQNLFLKGKLNNPGIIPIYGTLSANGNFEGSAIVRCTSTGNYIYFVFPFDTVSATPLYGFRNKISLLIRPSADMSIGSYFNTDGNGAIYMPDKSLLAHKWNLVEYIRSAPNSTYGSMDLYVNGSVSAGEYIEVAHFYSRIIGEL
jgi:hypothetical protein